jgi:MFS family permease
MDLSIENDTISSAGRAAHDVGLAALLGGNLFGRLAMNPALGRVSDPRERGEVVNTAWRRYGTVNSLGLAALLAGWFGARATETQPRYLNDRERSLARAKDVAVGAVAVTGIAAAIEGVRFARDCPDGAVPLADGATPSADTPPNAARRKRALNALSAAAIASEVALAGINAALAQANFRRPAKRRVLKRSY